MILANPVECVLNDVLANLLAVFAVIVDCVAPNRVITIGKVRAELAQVIPFGS